MRQMSLGLAGGEQITPHERPRSCRKGPATMANGYQLTLTDYAEGQLSKLPMAQVRTELVDALEQRLSADARMHDPLANEMTLQAVIFEHLSWLLRDGWRVQVEQYVQGTDYKADLLIQRLKPDKFRNSQRRRDRVRGEEECPNHRHCQ